MKWTERIAIGWLGLLVSATAYSRIDQSLGDPTIAEPHQGLPVLQDIYYQGPLWGTADRIEAPSWAHLLGTDVLGRDIFSRLIAGGGTAFVVVVAAAMIGMVVGGGLGALAGRLGGPLESVVMWVPEVIDSLPRLIFVLAVLSTQWPRSTLFVAGVLGVFAIPACARAARLHAASRQLVPALLAAGLAAGSVALLVEATLSFLGFGPFSPQPTWGKMMNEGRSEIRITILPVLWPALLLVLTAAALNQVADALGRRVAAAGVALGVEAVDSVGGVGDDQAKQAGEFPAVGLAEPGDQVSFERIESGE